MKKIIIFLLVFLLIAGSGGAAFYFYNKYVEMKGEVDSKKQEIEEVKELVEKVRELVELPEGEAPTVATVSDKEKLMEGWFFERAENGDKVLIFEKANRAVLYRPETGKIIEVGPVNTNNKNTEKTELEETGVVTEKKVLSLALYNGTIQAGVTGRLESELSDDYIVVVKENANKVDYVETVVVVLDDDYQIQASELAKELGAKLVSLMPEGESLPTKKVGAVVILGSEYLP